MTRRRCFVRARSTGRQPWWRHEETRLAAFFKRNLRCSPCTMRCATVSAFSDISASFDIVSTFKAAVESHSLTVACRLTHVISSLAMACACSTFVAGMLRSPACGTTLGRALALKLDRKVKMLSKVDFMVLGCSARPFLASLITSLAAVRSLSSLMWTIRILGRNIMRRVRVALQYTSKNLTLKMTCGLSVTRKSNIRATSEVCRLLAREMPTYLPSLYSDGTWRSW
mmetsp:Transcript_13541/g.33796  ORF Transcript_13541/g.33796 Transcript_13541/m.33796 type:complete len:227 (-) Transcript_13541:368-1048(-)